MHEHAHHENAQMPMHEVFVHHFRLPRRGEEMAHFLFCYAKADARLRRASAFFSIQLCFSPLDNYDALFC